MDEVRVRIRPWLLLCIVFAASLLQVSVGQMPHMLISFDIDDRNLVTLSCFEQGGTVAKPATFTFFDPPIGDETSPQRTETTDQNNRHTFSILPENEPLVSCRLNDGSVDSETVAITALPRYTGTATSILQYVFSDSDTIELTCPLVTGRLRGLIIPYEFLWRVKLEGDLNGQVEVTNANGTAGTFHYRDNNRLLSVNLSSLEPNVSYSFQCLIRLKRCNSTFGGNENVCREDDAEPTNSPFFPVNIVDPVVITNPPSNVSVTQGQDASFNCTVTNSGGDITIKWEINGTVYASENCSDLCTVKRTDNGNSTLTVHTLTVHTGNMDPVMNETTMNIVCIVTQTLPERPQGMKEYRNLSSEAAQLVLSPAPPPTQPTAQPTSPTSGPLSSSSEKGPGIIARDIYIITGVLCGFFLTIIIILSFCIVCIFRYHYKNKESMLGRRLRRTFSRDPQAMLQRFTKRDASPMELESQHFQGTESAPTNYADTVQVANGNHLLDPHGQIYNQSQQSGVSGVSSYSGLSGISQNNGPHHMPHYHEPSLTYQEGVAVQSLGRLPPPSVAGNGTLLIADPRSNGSRRTSDASGSHHSGQSLTHQHHHQQMYHPGTLHGSYQIIASEQHYPQHPGNPETNSLPHIPYVQYPTPSHVSMEHHYMQQQQPLDVQPSLPNLNAPAQFITYPQLAASQPLVYADRSYSMNSNHSHRSSSHHSSQNQSIVNQSPHISFNVPPAPQPHFISRNDLATVQLALMHNKHCQIPGCCCYKVREVMECRGYRAGPNDSPEMGSICSSGSGNSRLHRVGHQQSSTDSDSDYNSERDRRSRPANLRLLSEEHHRHPNLHPHYHLTTKSHLRRVNMQAPVDHRRSKSLSDLTPLTELPETQTPAKTPAVGGVIKPGTPVYDCQPALGEDNTEQRDEWNCPKGHPALLREISISADNIPALCLNDCPFTPSPLKEGRHPLAQSPNRLRRKGGSFRRGSLRSARSNLKTVKEKTNSDDTDDSNTSSRADSPIKSSLSDDDGIVADVEVCSTSKAKSAPQKTIVHQKELVPHEKTFVETAQALSVVTDFSLQDSSSDVEVSEILKTAHQRDIQNTPSSHSPILNRRNDGTNLSYLSSNGISMTDPRMRRSTSPLSVASSAHSRRSNSPYETEVVKQNGIITEITEC